MNAAKLQMGLTHAIEYPQMGRPSAEEWPIWEWRESIVLTHLQPMGLTLQHMTAFNKYSQIENQVNHKIYRATYQKE